MDQGGGGEYGGVTPEANIGVQQAVESASPISSRPPATQEQVVMRFSGEEEAIAEADRAGSGSRWPREETLALLKIRSDMDAAFRDATAKGPLWENVSRKLAELGYRRNAKKCKEKFENVHKYYKRTKEGRGSGRQDGKSYKFFSQLEALHHATSATTNISPSSQSQMPTLDVAPVSIGIPMPISSPSLTNIIPSTSVPMSSPINVPPAPTIAGITFSSNTSSSCPDTDGGDEDSDNDVDFNLAAACSSRKRKRPSSGTTTTDRMMKFFETLMKQVMQKQEAMQQKFLEVIEKREQDRMIREEAWKRQEMVRLAQDQELMAQERAISASRDAAIISFLQKITGQTIQLPSHTHASSPVVAPLVAAIPTPIPAPIPTSKPNPTQQEQHHQQPVQRTNLQHQQEVVHHRHHQSRNVSPVVTAVPEQHVPPSPQEISTDHRSFEPGNTTVSTSSSSFRWPKVEVLELIKLRSGLESRYQEAGPKGPLWEEISAGMSRMGFNRSAKRCKEKWENINKYYKKVKESNKKRPEDAKTCPYFHELDALYRRKTLSSTSSGNLVHDTIRVNPNPPPQTIPVICSAPSQRSENKNVDGQSNIPGTLCGEGSSNKPEDIVKGLIIVNQHEMQQRRQPPSVDGSDKIEELNIHSENDSDNMDDEEAQDEDDYDEELEQDGKINAYKIEFQTATPPNGDVNGAPSFMAMVQ